VGGRAGEARVQGFRIVYLMQEGKFCGVVGEIYFKGGGGGLCSKYVRNNGALTCCTCKDYTWKSIVTNLNFSRKALNDKCVIFPMTRASP